MHTAHRTPHTAHRTPLIVSLFILSLFTSSSHAGLIRNASSVTTDLSSNVSGGIGNIINQSGLSANYINGVTDFDTYVAGNPTHANAAGVGHWSSQPGTTTGNIDFDLGSNYIVSQIALWFTVHPIASNTFSTITTFTLFADDENTFAGATNLGNFTNSEFTDASVQVFDFSDTQAQFIRLQITANNGNTSQTRHGEAAFDTVSAVPAPAAVWLMGSALIGLLRFRKKTA